MEHRLPLWNSCEDILKLLKEGQSIQHHLSSPSRRHKRDFNLSLTFTQLLSKGKVRDAIRLFSPVNQKVVLDLSQIIPDGPNNGRTVLQLLKEKHPVNHSPHLDALMDEPPENYFPYSMFEALNEETIRFAALHTKGSAGPSCADALSWHHWCSCYGQKSIHLCRSITAFGRKICTNYVDPVGLSAFTGCHLIPLDKDSGVRPIGVVEVCRRIIGKAVMMIVKQDLQDAIDLHQFCTDFDSGCESAVHWMSRVFRH